MNFFHVFSLSIKKINEKKTLCLLKMSSMHILKLLVHIQFKEINRYVITVLWIGSIVAACLCACVLRPQALCGRSTSVCHTPDNGKARLVLKYLCSGFCKVGTLFSAGNYLLSCVCPQCSCIDINFLFISCWNNAVIAF